MAIGSQACNAGVSDPCPKVEGHGSDHAVGGRVGGETMHFNDLALVCATLLGPFFAVYAQSIIERRRGIRDRRRGVFRTLMATRANIVDPAHVNALNAIDLEFEGKAKGLKEVRDAWKEYRDH